MQNTLSIVEIQSFPSMAWSFSLLLLLCCLCCWSCDSVVTPMQQVFELQYCTGTLGKYPYLYSSVLESWEQVPEAWGVVQVKYCARAGVESSWRSVIVNR